MARKRHSDEDILRLLREIEVNLHDGMGVVSACRKAGVSDKTYIAELLRVEGWHVNHSGRDRGRRPRKP